MTGNITHPLTPAEAEHWEATCREFIESDDRVKRLYGQLMRDFGITAQNVTAGVEGTGEDISSFSQALAWATADLAGCFAKHNVDPKDHERFATEFAGVVGKMIGSGLSLPTTDDADTPITQASGQPPKVIRVALMNQDGEIITCSPDVPELQITGETREAVADQAKYALAFLMKERGTPGMVEQADIDDPDVIAFIVWPEMESLSDAAMDVIRERRRQIEAEGWTPEHDDRHKEGQLAFAAGTYALDAATDAYHDAARQRKSDNMSPPMTWPFAAEWWKPTDRRRDLVKAAALLVAEIERLDRENAQ